jgi:hypothetical protein
MKDQFAGGTHTTPKRYVSLQSSRYNFSSYQKLSKPETNGTNHNFYPLVDQCEDYAAGNCAGTSANENSAVVNQSSKNPGLKIISKQVMRAVHQNGLTTYKEVANVVSQVSPFTINFKSKTRITKACSSKSEMIPIETLPHTSKASSQAKKAS